MSNLSESLNDTVNRVLQKESDTIYKQALNDVFNDDVTDGKYRERIQILYKAEQLTRNVLNEVLKIIGGNA